MHICARLSRPPPLAARRLSSLSCLQIKLDGSRQHSHYRSMPKVLVLGATGGEINGHASHASASH